MYRTEFHAMGGANEIVVDAPSAAHASAAFKLAMEEVLRIQNTYSRYREDSVVQLINREAGRGTWVDCDQEMLSLVDAAGEFFRISQGFFDITSGVLRKAWDFKNGTVPHQEQVNPLLKLVGFDLIERAEGKIRLPLVGMELDLGGLGKEYAVDCAVAKLSGAGITSGYVNLGGDIGVVGPAPDGSAWQVGLDHPRKNGAMLGKISITSGGLTTSSDSQKFLVRNGQRFSHILNPKTGFPPNCWSSVSVIAANCLLAGFLSTTAMLMEDNAKSFLRQHCEKFLLVNLAGKIEEEN